MKLILKFFQKFFGSSIELNIILFGSLINLNALFVFYSQGRDDAALLSLLLLISLLCIYKILYTTTKLNYIVAIYRKNNQEQFYLYENQDQAIETSEIAISEVSEAIECIIILQLPYNPFLKKIKNCIGIVSYATVYFIPKRCETLLSAPPLNAIQSFIDTGFQSEFSPCCLSKNSKVTILK